MPKKNPARKRKNQLINQVHFPDAAGIDIGATEFYASIGRRKAREARLEHPVSSFSSFNSGIKECIEWFTEHDIKSVAMETTGNYWVALFDQLSAAGFEVYLVNAGHCKALPGRKTDVCDADWIQQLHTAGLLRSSYVLDIDRRAVRYLIRHRENYIRDAARELQHMQKAYVEMNVQLHHVLSDIDGWSGRRITKAIVDGERDAEALADLRHATCKTPRATVIEALSGNFRDEYIFVLKQSYHRFEAIEKQILEVEQEIDRLLRAACSAVAREAPAQEYAEGETPKAKRYYTLKAGKPGESKRRCSVDFRSYCRDLFGVDLLEIDGIGDGVLCDVIAELGDKEKFLSSFKSGKQFSSWLSLCPDNRITGGKIKGRGKTRKGGNKLSRALCLAAMSLGHSKSWLGDYSRKMKARLGKAEGITATAHKLARIIYSMIAGGKPYDPAIGTEVQKQSVERQINAIRKKAEKLGLQVLQPPAQTEAVTEVEVASEAAVVTA